MINFLAICLVLACLSASGVWSPTPEKHQKEGQDVFAGDGHKAQHNTRVSTSDRHGFISDSDEEKRRSSSNYLQTTKSCVEGAHNDMHGLKEFTCDALGKYKHETSTAVGKGKEMALEKGRQAKEAGFAKAEDVEEKAKETIGRVKDKVSEKTIDLEDLVKEAAEKGIEIMKEAKDIGKIIRHDIATNVSETLETTEEEANARGKETTKTTKLVAERVRVESQKATNALIRGGRKLVILMAAPALASAVSLFGVAIAFGMGVWVTFLSSYVSARAIPRHQVALAHSKIYPIYFRAMALSIVMTFLGHLLRRKILSSPDTALVLQGYNLSAALLLVFANLYVEPRARKVMFDKEKAEKDEGRGGRGQVEMVDSVLTDEAGRESHDHPYETEDADNSPAVRRGAAPPKVTPHVPEGEPTIDELSRRLKKLNFVTSFLNGVTLMALAWHLVFFNQRLSFNI